MAKDSVNKVLINQLNYQKKHTSEKQLFSELDALQLQFEQMGFFNNKLDTLVKKDTVYIASFYLGSSTKFIRIYYEHEKITEEILKQFSKKKDTSYVEIPIHRIQEILTYIVSSYEDRGFTFTDVHLSDIQFSKDILIAQLQIRIPDRRKIDKVLVNGVDQFPDAFIRHYFKINSNSVFSKKQLSDISTQIKALPFVKETKPPEVLFTNDSTYVYLYLEKVKANTFDGLLGFTSSDTDRKLTFNGYLDLNLQNSFNGGEKLAVHWNNNGNGRQTFNLKAEVPYIFKSNLTPTFDLNIYKQDSSFINTRVGMALGYSISYNQKLSIALKSESSNNVSDLPIESIQDYTSAFYGANYNYSIYDNSTIFPIRFNVNTGAYFGNRKSNNSTANQTLVDFQSYYNWNLNPKNSFFLQNSTAVLTSEKYLVNELFRIGGHKTIRGFNEETIFATLYSVFNVEYRYTPTLSSYFYTISDFAYIENQAENLNQRLYSLGLGYAFRTNFGFLNLSYAIGKVDNLPFSFDNSRVHLNFITFF